MKAELRPCKASGELPPPPSSFPVLNGAPAGKCAFLAGLAQRLPLAAHGSEIFRNRPMQEVRPERRHRNPSWIVALRAHGFSAQQDVI